MSNNSKTETKPVEQPKGVVVTDIKEGEAPKTGNIVPINFGEIEDTEKANLLQYYLNSANPVYKNVSEEVENSKGKKIVRNTKVVINYTYPYVDGLKFQDWIQKNINKNYQLDIVKNQVVRPVTPQEAKDAQDFLDKVKKEQEKA